ncbi:MAG: hypothetical protein ACI8RZ_005864 [Myxococcota bacterium]|jgi:hypothetical protein
MSAMVWLLIGCASNWALEDADGDGFTWLEGDCDDSNPTVFPSAIEVCDSVDNNCDGETDIDSPQAITWYGDVDGDGFTGETLTQVSCEIPPGYTAEPTDCDDSNSAISPDATEYCNDLDDNCNGEVDEDGAIGGTVYFTDVDGDGYGDANSPVSQCTQSNSSSNGDDCDDTRAESYPGADELCDGADNDCDTTVDEDPVDESNFYADTDGDGFGDENDTTKGCEAPSGYVEDDDDCDDTDATIYPDSMRLEVPRDGIDVDCDGLDVCIDLSCDGRPDVVLPLLINDDDVYQLESPVYLSTDLTSSVTIETAGVLAGDSHDLNGDGYRDVVLASGFNGTTCEENSRIYWGDGTDVLDGVTELPTSGARDVQIADIDGDGRRDLLFGGATEGCEDGLDASPALIFWNSNGSFASDDVTKTGTQDVWEVDVGDIDDDGEKDILLCRHRSDDSYSTSSIILWGDGREFNGYTELATSGCADQLLEDLDGDGLLDIVFANYRDDSGYEPTSTVYWNDDNRFETATTESLATTAAWSVQGADIDRDGDVDLVFGALADLSNDKELWELDTLIFVNEGGTYADPIALETPGSPHPAVADLDSDGRMDVVVAGYRTNDAFPNHRVIDSYIYWGGDGYSEKGRTSLETDGAWQATVVDFDADDNLDILLSSYFDGSTYAADSRVYWGSTSGFSESNTTDLAVSGGVYAAPVVVGN